MEKEGFRFQQLDVYKVAKELAVRVHEARIAEGGGCSARAPAQANASCAHRHKPVSRAIKRSAMRAISRLTLSEQSPRSAAISTAAAASTASARAIAKDRALSPRVTRPAPSAVLRHADLADRRASSRSFASRMCASRTALNRS